MVIHKMELSKKLVDEFKEIMKRNYNYEFETEADASRAANNLVRYFDLLLKIEARESPLEQTNQSKSNSDTS